MRVAWFVFGISLFLLMVASPAIAILGEQQATASSHAAEWKNKYGAIQPIFSADSAGKVVNECWAAPADMWTETRALAFAKELLPKAVKKMSVKHKENDGHLRVFNVGASGYRIYLSGIGKMVIQVEVSAPSWKGGNC